MAAIHMHIPADMMPDARTMAHLIQEDHDVLIRLVGTVESLTDITKRLDKRDEDFEKRLRWVERVLFGAGGAAFIIMTLLKLLGK